MQRVPMTQQGAEKLQAELERLKRIERPRITESIAEARAHGDLKENAEYHAAREQQGLNEARIRDLEHKLSLVQVIDITKMPNTGKVIFGTTVDLLDEDTDKIDTYQIVGEEEADINQHKISITSPLARALIGKAEGDEVEVNTPKGETFYIIKSVKYI